MPLRWILDLYGPGVLSLKNIFKLWIVAALLWSAGVSTAAEPYRIVGLGDSLMAGFGLLPGEAFPEKLEIALRGRGQNVVISNAGVSGDTSSGGLARLDWSVPDGTDLVILELGANDMLRGIDPAAVRENLEAMIVSLKKRNIDILLAGMRATPSLGQEYQSDFDSIYPDLAMKHDIPLYPFFLEGVATNSDLLLEDGLHPNSAGVELMVEGVVPMIEALVGEPRS